MKGPVLMVELVRFFGWRRASALLGLSALWGALIPESMSDVEAMPGAATTARYVADLRRFGEHIKATGVEAEIGDEIGELLTSVLANQQIAELGKRVASSTDEEASSGHGEQVRGEHPV